jgi:DNA-binding NarL/FixJ family response regulator
MNRPGGILSKVTGAASEIESNRSSKFARPRVLLADDHALVLEAFRSLLEPEFEIVGAALDGRELIEKARELKPDLIVADIWMPQLNGLEACRAIHAESPATKIVFLTANEDADYAAAAFRLGAAGYLLKSSAGSELRRCLAEIRSGGRYLTPLIAGGVIRDLLMDRPEGKSAESLSTREREVLQLLAEGKAMKEAAAVLGVATRTIAFHKYHIMKQFGLRSNAELIQLAIRCNVIQG